MKCKNCGKSISEIDKNWVFNRTWVHDNTPGTISCNIKDIHDNWEHDIARPPDNYLRLLADA